MGKLKWAANNEKAMDEGFTSQPQCHLNKAPLPPKKIILLRKNYFYT